MPKSRKDSCPPMDNAFSSRVIKGVMSTGFASLVTLVSGFLNIMIAVRFVPREHFGVYILLQVLVSSLSALSDLGVNLSTTKHLAGQDEEGRFSIVNTILGFKLLVALFVGLTTFLCGNLLYGLFNSQLFFNIAVFIPVLYIMENLCSLMGSMLQGFHHYRKMAVAQIILSVAGIFFIIVFVVLLRLGLMGLIYARLLSLLFCFSYQVMPFVRRITMRFDKGRFKEIFYFGFPLGLNSILSFIFLRIDTLLIGAMLNPLQVAYYGTSTKIPDASRNLFESSFRSVFFPNMSELFSRGNNMEAKTLLANSLRLVSFLALFCTLVIILFRREVVGLLFSVKYLDSAPILSLLMIALSIGLIGNILGTSLVAAGHSKLPVMINLVDTAVSLTANLVLIPMFGVIGAAYAAILARALTNPVNVWFLKRNGIEVRVTEYLRPALIFAVCMVIYVTTGSGGILMNISIIILFLAACLGFSVIRRNDFITLVKIIKQHGQSLESRA